jgi:CHAD domain-containing protein
MSSVAFRLRNDEPVGKGLHRIVKRELRKAAARLTDGTGSKAIHTARKRIKRVRAVLQLVGDDVGADGAVKELRRASHLLNPLRDADAMIDDAVRAKAARAIDRVRRDLRHWHWKRTDYSALARKPHTRRRPGG